MPARWRGPRCGPPGAARLPAIGMRASYCYAVRNQNRLVYEADEDFLRACQAKGARWRRISAAGSPFEDDLHAGHDAARTSNEGKPTRIQLAPANLHWCTDNATDGSERPRRSATRRCTCICSRPPTRRNMHAVAPAPRAVKHLDKLGMVAARLDPGPRRVVDRRGHRIAAPPRRLHLPQLQLQLPPAQRRGTAQHVRGKGINVGIGLDEAGINDDRDMLQEMGWCCARIACRAWSTADVPTCPQVLRMATGRRHDHVVRRRHRLARGRQGGRHGAASSWTRLSLSRRADPDARRRRAARRAAGRSP